MPMIGQTRYYNGFSRVLQPFGTCLYYNIRDGIKW